MRKYLYFFGAIFITLFCACGNKSHGNNEINSERIFPEFRFSASDGNTYTQKDLEKGVSVSGFMVSWCLPCAGELERLQNIKNKYTSRQLQVFVFTYEDFDKYDSLTKTLNLDLPIIKADSSFFALMNIDAIPTRILSNDGREITRIIGAPSFEEEAFQADLKKNLGIKEDKHTERKK
ncbi:redoxin domain-containing protein [bacterium]|nr:redoxin domain-containing protein [bacterium]